MRMTEEWLRSRERKRKAVASVPAKPASVAVRPPATSEDAEQIALFEWAQYVSVGVRTLFDCIHHTPNGGHRTPFEAGRFKAMGVKAGIPDVCLPIGSGDYIGGWWELKVGNNTPSDSQVRMHEFLRAEGHYVDVCWHWQAAAESILRYLNHSKHVVVVRMKVPA